MQDALATTGATTLVVLNRFYDKVKRVQPATSLQQIIVTNIKEYLPFFLSIAFTLFKEKKEGDRITLAKGDLRFGGSPSRVSRTAAAERHRLTA